MAILHILIEADIPFNKNLLLGGLVNGRSNKKFG